MVVLISLKESLSLMRNPKTTPRPYSIACLTPETVEVSDKLELKREALRGQLEQL